VEPHFQRHATAFYNIIVPLFEAAGDTYKIMNKVKYYRIMEAILCPRDDKFSYLEQVFSDLLVGHGPDHSKGKTLYAHVAEIVSNIPREVCKHFTDTCPRCIERQKRMRPTAGLRPIVTSRLNTCGQVDLIDFQSMPDGDFCFLLNYIDH
jgi:hypothetical protein